MSALVLSDVKARLGITTSGTDTILQETIDEAEATLAQHVGPLTQQAVTERQISTGGGIVLSQPVVSLTRAMHVWSQYTLVTADLELVSTNTMTRRYGVGFIPGPWDVTYTAGYASTPPVLLRAALELTLDLWRISRGAPVLQQAPVEPQTGMPNDDLPRRVRRMIARYELNGAS